MPSSSDDILEQTLRCLSPHRHAQWGDRFPFDVFTRLLAKNIRLNGWTSNTHLDIRTQQISSRKERWTTPSLAELARGHQSTAGEDFPCPIIIAIYDGKQRLLDGNHRINRWISKSDTSLHDVNIHEVSGLGRFVELAGIHSGSIDGGGRH